MIDILYISKKSSNFVGKILEEHIKRLMKRFILSIMVLALALGASAKNYLVSSEATTESAKISYKGADYVVGVDAFASIVALMNANQ